MVQAIDVSIEGRIRDRTARVGVIGLGYVGLPILTGIAKAGFEVIGFDKDYQKLNQLRAGVSYIEDVPDDDLPADGRYAMTPLEAVGLDVLVIAVPTPLTDGVADLTYVRRAVEDGANSLGRGGLVCLESTTYPGTTRDEVLPLLQRDAHAGWVVGDDFSLVYSPERIDPGSGVLVSEIPKLVSGLTDRCLRRGLQFYETFIDHVVPVRGVEEAELAKLIENTFRLVNISLVNQLVALGPNLKVDVWEALRAAGTKPFGYMPFQPGPGAGGHCIPLDALYLTHRVRQLSGSSLPIVDAANEVNQRMPRYVVDRVAELLNEHGLPVRGSQIVQLGIAYKPNVADVRESAAAKVRDLLVSRGAEVMVFDPFVDEPDIAAVPTVVELESADLVLLVTDHDAFDYEMIGRQAKYVFDTRGRMPDGPNVTRL